MNVYSLGYIQTHVARWRLHHGPLHIVYPYARVYTRMVVLDRELRTFIHVKRAKRFDPVG